MRLFQSPEVKESFLITLLPLQTPMQHHMHAHCRVVIDTLRASLWYMLVYQNKLLAESQLWLNGKEIGSVATHACAMHRWFNWRKSEILQKEARGGNTLDSWRTVGRELAKQRGWCEKWPSATLNKKITRQVHKLSFGTQLVKLYMHSWTKSLSK